jgi:geranylgeranyl diphosphate synthase type I
MSEKTGARAILDRCRPLVDAEIGAVLGGRPDLPLYQMLRYHLGLAGAPDGSPPPSTGKRVRSTLCLLACQAGGGKVEWAVPAAAAIELLHSFTLLHDDIADRDETRRGRPTVWRLWGVAQAITAGDAIYALAGLALSRLDQAQVPPAAAVSVWRELTEAALGVCEGQQLDLAYEGRADLSVDDYLTMIALKTAALISASTGIGARVAGAPEETAAALRSFGHHLGLAYQIQDDVLGIWGDPDRLGKPVGSDLARNKRTLPVIHFLSRSEPAQRGVAARLAAGLTGDEIVELAVQMQEAGSRAFCERLAQESLQRALDQLQPCHLEPEAAADLRRLTAYLMEREQ